MSQKKIALVVVATPPLLPLKPDYFQYRNQRDFIHNNRIGKDIGSEDSLRGRDPFQGREIAWAIGVRRLVNNMITITLFFGQRSYPLSNQTPLDQHLGCDLAVEIPLTTQRNTQMLVAHSEP